MIELVHVQVHRHVRVPGVLPFLGDDALLHQTRFGQLAAQRIGGVFQCAGGVLHLVVTPKGFHDLLVGDLGAAVQQQVYQQLDGFVHTAAFFHQVPVPHLDPKPAEHFGLQAFGLLHEGFSSFCDGQRSGTGLSFRGGQTG